MSHSGPLRLTSDRSGNRFMQSTTKLKQKKLGMESCDMSMSGESSSIRSTWVGRFTSLQLSMLSRNSQCDKSVGIERLATLQKTNYVL